MSTTTMPSGVQPAGRQPDAIHILPIVVDLTVIAAVSLLLNFFPERVGYWVSAVRPDSFVPVLSPDFGGAPLALLNLWLGLAFSLGLVHLALRRWIPATRLADLGLTALAVIALAALAAGGPIGKTAGIDLLIKVSLGLACFGVALSAIGKLTRLIMR